MFLKARNLLMVVMAMLISNSIYANTSTMTVLDSGSLKWSDVSTMPPGAKVALLSGNPEKHQPFVARIKLPANYTVPAHSHPINECETVVSGKLYMQAGDKKDLSQAKMLVAGDFVMIPARLVHNSWTEQETIVQISGVGPWKMIYAKAE